MTKCSCRISSSPEFHSSRIRQRFSHALLYNSILYYVHLSRPCHIALNVFMEFFFVERKIVCRERKQNGLFVTEIVHLRIRWYAYTRLPCTTIHHLFSSSIKYLARTCDSDSDPNIYLGHTIRNFSRLPPLTQAKFYRTFAPVTKIPRVFKRYLRRERNRYVCGISYIPISPLSTD